MTRSRGGVLVGILIALAVLSAAAFAGWTWYQGTPQYATLKAIQALSDRDYGAFSQWVDVDAVIAAEAARRMPSRPPGLSADLYAKLQAGVKAATKQIVRQRIQQGVRGIPPHVPFTALLVSGVVRGATVSGDEARVVATSRYGGKSLVADLRLQRRAGVWRIVGVDNASQLLGGGL